MPAFSKRIFRGIAVAESKSCVFTRRGAAALKWEIYNELFLIPSRTPARVVSRQS
jgi:hypothetical protein